MGRTNLQNVMFHSNDCCAKRTKACTICRLWMIRVELLSSHSKWNEYT